MYSNINKKEGIKAVKLYIQTFKDKILSVYNVEDRFSPDLLFELLELLDLRGGK